MAFYFYKFGINQYNIICMIEIGNIISKEV